MRSLGATLTSAAATFALFAAANWGPVMFDVMFLTAATESFIQLLIVQTITAVGFPQVGLYRSVENAIEAWRVKKALMKLAATNGSNNIQKLNHGQIAIMSVCPLFLQVPESARKQLCSLLRSAESPNLMTREELISKWCPLELWLAEANNIDQHKDDNPLSEDEEKKAHIRQRNVLIPNPAGEENKAVEAGARVVYGIDAHQEINSNDQPAEIGNAATDHNRLGKYIEVLYTEDREALLMSGLVPTYRELQYLRKRNRFQTAVTTLQAGGYMLGLAERLMHHLDISPIEAIISFLCVLAAPQLLIELYACSHYQRHLLLDLKLQHVATLDDTVKKHGRNFDAHKIRINSSKTSFACSNLLLFLMSLPLMYYVYHYWHVSLVSALAALLFMAAVAASSVLLTREKFSRSEKVCRWDCAVRLPLIHEDQGLPLSAVCSGVMCGCGMALAVVATVVDWHTTFEKPTPNPFSWILPHASTAS